MIFPYTKTKLMTDAELQFYHFMTNNLFQVDKIVILAKVRLGDIVEVDPLVDTSMEYYMRIASKHVDYVICDKNTMDIICVVELDDFTHYDKKAKTRDEFVAHVLEASGIKLIRVGTRVAELTKESIEDIDLEINKVFAPKCPFCGKKMIPTQYVWNKHRFFVCSNYKNECKYIINIDGEQLPCGY